MCKSVRNSLAWEWEELGSDTNPALLSFQFLKFKFSPVSKILPVLTSYHFMMLHNSNFIHYKVTLSAFEKCLKMITLHEEKIKYLKSSPFLSSVLVACPFRLLPQIIIYILTVGNSQQIGTGVLHDSNDLWCCHDLQIAQVKWEGCFLLFCLLVLYFRKYTEIRYSIPTLTSFSVFSPPHAPPPPLFQPPAA